MIQLPLDVGEQARRADAATGSGAASRCQFLFITNW